MTTEANANKIREALKACKCPNNYHPGEVVSAIQDIIREEVVKELLRLKKFDSFNEPYTWSGDTRPGKLVDIRIAELKGGNDEE